MLAHRAKYLYNDKKTNRGGEDHVSYIKIYRSFTPCKASRLSRRLHGVKGRNMPALRLEDTIEFVFKE